MLRDERQGVVTTRELSTGEVAEVDALAALCNAHDGLDLPLNLEPSPDEANQFLYAAQGTLVGFLSLEGDPAAPEACGMVHPAHRRRGIGRLLLAAARDECRRRGVASLLLVCEDGSPAGRAFVQATGAQYRNAEHRMEFVPAARPASVREPPPIELRPASPADLDLLVYLTAQAFGDAEDDVRRRFVQELGRPDRRFFIATLQRESVGSLRLTEDAERVYITAFGVLPQHRRQGYARQMLAQAIDLLHAEGRPHIFIEVDTGNTAAFSLYLSCGFRVTRTYGFYHLQP
jgi:ribosomal protein S18 acetylase RimI-like enzyme